jgi:hypothetical protein
MTGGTLSVMALSSMQSMTGLTRSNFQRRFACGDRSGTPLVSVRPGGTRFSLAKQKKKHNKKVPLATHPVIYSRISNDRYSLRSRLGAELASGATAT